MGVSGGRLVEVAAIDCRLESHDWAFARDEASRIDTHWAGLCAEKPSLWDGRVLLAHHVVVEGDRLVGACFETGFKSFLSWRDFGFPGARVANIFAMPALRSADGAFLLGEMSPGTANAGRLYFPAGTPEPADVTADGRVDYEGSILRELEEETGLAPDEVALDARWTIVFSERPVIGCMRIARSPLTVEALQGRLAAHNAELASPELVRLVPVRERRDLDPGAMPDFMLTYLGAQLS